MQGTALFLGRPDGPFEIIPAHFFGDFGSGACGINDRMFSEHGTQAIGQAADKTFTGTLMQLIGHFHMIFGFIAHGEYDIVRSLLGAAKKN